MPENRSLATGRGRTRALLSDPDDLGDSRRRGQPTRFNAVDSARLRHSARARIAGPDFAANRRFGSQNRPSGLDKRFPVL